MAINAHRQTHIGIRDSALRTWTFPQKMILDLTAFTTLAWIGFVVLVALITAVADHFTPIDNSAWESAARGIPWFTLIIGVRVGSKLLPVSIAHGKTRRGFTIETVIFLAIYSLAAALLTTLGWVLERAFFAATGWSQALNDTHLFATAHVYPEIFIESWLIVLAWTAAGVLISAAYYRFDASGLLAIAPCLLISGVLQAAIGAGSTWGPLTPIVDRVFDPGSPSVVVAIVTGLACFGLILAMAWMVIRDIPMRSKTA